MFRVFNEGLNIKVEVSAVVVMKMHYLWYRCQDLGIPLNPSKCEASFFLVDPHQADLQPNLLLLGSRLRFNPTPTFLGVTFDRTLSFS